MKLLIHMTGYADHLMAKAVHPSEAPKVHLMANAVRPSEASDYMLAYTVHHVRLLIYMIGHYLMANAVHPSEASEVHLSVVPNVR